ncbi:MAG: zinc-ribbon domain-containing protein, partial [Candidatus Njordarchaeota archaeon]
CPNCGAEIPLDAVFCPKCGAKLAESTVPRQTQQPVTQQPVAQTSPSSYSGDRKDPILAAILSFILPGIGQIYVGATTRGVVYIILAIILYALFIIPGIIFAIYTMYDAYRLAQQYNETGLIPNSIFGY